MKRKMYLITMALFQIILIFNTNMISTLEFKAITKGDRYIQLNISSGEEYKRILGDILVNEYIDSHQRYPSICELSGEKFAVAWAGNGNGDPGGIYARVFDAATGKNITSEFQVNFNTTSTQSDPSICSLTEDKIAIAWFSNGQDGDDLGVYARIFNATTGKNITQEFRVNFNTTKAQWRQSICALSEDKIAIAWESNDQDGSSYGVYARVFNATTGMNITSEFRVNSWTNLAQENPSICSLSEDKFAITWMSNDQDGSNYGVYAKIFNATTGKNITAEFQVNYETLYNQNYPSICALSEDKIAIAWQSSQQDGNGYGVYARVFNATTGENITKEFQINSWTDDDQLIPSICALSEDKIAIAWESLDQDNAEGEIYTRVFNATSGESITSESRANSWTANEQEYLSICALSESKYAVAWDSFGQDLPATYGIYATVFETGSGSSIVETSSDDDDDDDTETIPGFSLEILTAALFIGITSLILYYKRKK